ncbi:hypothetical protein TRM7557_00804 [Tritonibacter multivorans]|uniref:Uncharacterized protein n=1 Tax=Tritonibacter multivorans TaxID=928856 RepID=A0A0P1G387_9RHOB|nr:hypothetical protein [Tritonibacter multivorans]MDA7422851.1 hypothetical protein [Tritonibacter multivorans]CUH76277.1 hypothetical protein TRM7557_00804 [Tritonibacter multivorans]SFD61964.1 hypothetical protein SAMN04488049_11825 [Tritonibacter multivorans]
MPIAQIFVTEPVLAAVPAAERGDLVRSWADLAGESGAGARAHMTVNLVPVAQQLGRPIPVLAQLSLPDLWRPDQVEALALGLARACAQLFRLEAGQVQVLCHGLPAGHVATDQAIERW